jgi:hypothetical protein
VLKLVRTADQDKVKELRRAYSLLDEMPDSSAMLKNRFWAISKRKEDEQTVPIYEVRSYMDYCPHGTLQDLFDKYGKATWTANNEE